MLIENWWQVLKRAWSVRLIALAVILSGAEVALPLLPMKISPGIFAALSAITSAAAVYARLMAQRNLPNADK